MFRSWGDAIRIGEGYSPPMNEFLDLEKRGGDGLPEMDESLETFAAAKWRRGCFSDCEDDGNPFSTGSP